jgi:hypothetical protein
MDGKQEKHHQCLNLKKAGTNGKQVRSQQVHREPFHRQLGRKTKQQVEKQ